MGPTPHLRPAGGSCLLQMAVHLQTDWPEQRGLGQLGRAGGACERCRATLHALSATAQNAS